MPPLFETDRKNRLTPMGLRVLEECDRTLTAFDRGVAAIGRHAKSTAGTVRIATVPSALLTVLPRAIAAFRTARPQVRLEISDLDSAAALARVQYDEADIAIASVPAGGSPKGGVVLLTDRLGIICRADGASAAAPRSWQSLGLEPLIANPLCALVDHPLVRDMVLRSTLDARNTATLLSFVRSGFGATILPESVLGSDPDLVFIAPDDPPVHRHLMALESPRRQSSPATRAFMDLLTATASD